jgi:predicted transcriptional regulator
VRDGKGPASQHLATYNVFSIPTYFLINKKGELVLRDMQIEDLTKEIEKLLKE